MKSTCLLTCIMECESHCRDPWANAYEYDICKTRCDYYKAFCVSRCAGNPYYTASTTVTTLTPNA